MLVREILLQTKDKLAFRCRNLHNVFVQWAWKEVWWVYCHVNADTLIFTYYLWFEEIYVFTFIWNKNKKEDTFKKYKKIKIIEL